MLPWILLLTASLLLFVEFYLPSGVVLFCSGCLLIYAIYAAYIGYTALSFGVFIAVSLLAGAASVYLALYIIRRSASKNTFCLSMDQKDFVADHPSHSLLHKEGVALTPLCPSGIVEIDGRRIQAQSQGVYIEKGKKVSVVKIQGSTCIVVQKQVSTLN
jgi:membrane-bound serine protease (ClpP class)